MKKQITIEIDQTLLENAKTILNAQYLNIETAFEMFLNRTIREQSILWLFENKALAVNNSDPCVNDNVVQETTYSSTNLLPAANGMTKNIAIRLFIANGNTVSKIATYASKNKAANYYWANPNYGDVINYDWSLILNDSVAKKLYLFLIPKFTFTIGDFVTRSDKPNLIDLQIAYNDPTFTDNRSKISFRKFLKDEINY